MQRSRFGILIGVLTVLIGIAWLAGVFDSEYSTLEIPEWQIDAGAIDAVDVVVDSDTVAAFRQGDGWVLSKPLSTSADTAYVRRTIQNFADLQLGSVVSANAARYSNYGVDSTASVVTLSSDQGTRTVVVGNQTPDRLGSFVRLDDDSRVFSTAKPIRINSQVDLWRDKVVLDVPFDAVAEAVVSRAGADSYKLLNTTGTWKLEFNAAEGTIADSAAVVRWIKRFAPLRGDGFVQLSTDELTPVGSIAISVMGGTSTALDLFENDSFLIIRRPSDDALLRVTKGRKESLLPDPGTLTRN